MMGMMGGSSVGRAALVGLVWVALWPAPAEAQTGAIAGVVRDASGGVLPGVTVEAASPALIEKLRSVVTDTEGRYNIVDLRPGEYAVTFTLEGFNTLKRDGITLSAGFTAAVNADLQVGALSETITVSGAAPLVDTQNVRQQQVVSAELLETLPSGAKGFMGLARLVPGMSGGADS
ncbi:MAG: carboxypeptidase-like regulatory domain-containing protein, partial [Vicinamibacterales bacterium]